MTGPLVVVGDALLDIDIAGTSRRSVPDAASAPVLDVTDGVRRPGGAGLAALLAAADAVPVHLVTALANDEEGHWLAGALAERVELVAGPALGPSCLKTRVLDRGRPVLRLDHGMGTCAGATSAMLDTLRDAGAVLVADYGRGVTADPGVVRALCELSGRVPVVWDPHPHGRFPVPGCAVVTPNLAEARRALHPHELPSDPAEGGLASAPRLRELWAAKAAAVTLGPLGAALARGRARPVLLPATRAPEQADCCGAGDCFAATLAARLWRGDRPIEAISAAVGRASEFVTEGGAAAIRPTSGENLIRVGRTS